MNYEIIDAKLKNLIQICKDTQNYKKLAVVSFILTSNRLNEIGINLGVRARNHSSGERIFEYMELINDIFYKNLQVPIFPNEHIDIIRQCEILFLKNKGNIPLEYIKQMFTTYYDLRRMEVPNLHKSLKQEEFLESSKLGIFSFLSSRNTSKNNHTSDLKPLLLQKISEKESNLRKNLQHELNSQNFETAIHLHSLKKSITKQKTGKIIVQGALKDNIIYRKSIESIFGYFILGLVILLVSLGIMILLELSVLPIVSSGLSSLVLIFFTCAVILIYFYIKQFRKGR
ncbi:MAG: hypothetical protein JSV62_01015 [Promethearchaeota archaeon]|nr:MAG: hypothetical protein JSV62_01015 [Candidatus Lokiarchaeota archaeon]